VLLITHEMDVVRRICDSVALLDAGRVVERGPLGEVVARPGSRLAAGLLPAFGRIDVEAGEQTREVIVLDDAVLEVPHGARVEASVTERIGGRRVTRALLVEARQKAAA
jgi:D-methionine transport system ATP-binding protein